MACCSSVNSAARRMLLSVFVVAIMAAMTLGTSRQAGAQQAGEEVLRGTWAPTPPYQIEAPGKPLGIGGLDIEILSRVANEAGYQLELKRKPWSAQLDGLLAGRSDIASGAFLPAGGDERFLYSIPYREVRLSLFLRKDDQDSLELGDVARLVATDRNFRIGVIPGRSFEDPRLNEAIGLAEKEGRTVPAQSDEENLGNLLAGKIDGFIGDRLGVAASALAADLQFHAYEKVLPGSSGVHFIFSKATVSPETVARFNDKIAELKSDGTIGKLVNRRVFATVVAYAFDHPLLRSIEIIGIIAFAFSGVLIAYREHYNLAGAFILSALPTVGGGALRDVLLGRHPIGILATPVPLCLIIATVVVGLGVIEIFRFGARRGWKVGSPVKLSYLLESCDAIGLGAFTVTAVAIVVSMGVEPLWLWGPISALLTGAGGGIMRDVVRQAGHVAALKSEFYAEVPVIWGGLLCAYILLEPPLTVPEHLVLVVVVTVLGTFLTRMAAVYFGFRGIPFGWRGKD